MSTFHLEGMRCDASNTYGCIVRFKYIVYIKLPLEEIIKYFLVKNNIYHYICKKMFKDFVLIQNPYECHKCESKFVGFFLFLNTLNNYK